MQESLFADQKTHNLILISNQQKKLIRKSYFSTKSDKKIDFSYMNFCILSTDLKYASNEMLSKRVFLSKAQRTAQKNLKVFCFCKCALEFNFATFSGLECFIFAKRSKLLYPLQGFLLIIRRAKRVGHSFAYVTHF